MVFHFKSPFPEFYEADSEAEAKQQSKQDKASDRSKKSNEAAAGKDGRTTQKLPLSQKNGGGNQTEMSSNRITETDVKNRNAEKPSKQPGPSRKSDVEKQKTKKHNVPSPPINRSNESATGGKKPEKKSYSSPDSRNSMKVKDTLLLRVRLHCNCEGCVDRVRETVLKFKGVQRVAVKADKDMVKVMGLVERKELESYLEEKLRWNLAYLPIKDYDNVVDDHTEDEADGGPMTDSSPGISTTVLPTCRYSREDESSLPGDEQKVANIVVLKIRQYCQEGCVQQTQKSLESFQGVESINIDADEGQVKVTGTMKVEELVSHLQKKLKREVELISVERIKNVTDELNIVAEASGGCGIEVEKVAKVVEELSQVKNVPDGRDTKVSVVMKASNKSKAMSRVHVDNLNDLKNGNADLSCTKHNSQYGSVGDKVHYLDKVVKVGAKGMHKEENVSGGREVRSQKASKKSKADSRVHPVNLDEQTKMNPDLSQNKTRSGIDANTMHHLENSMEGKRQNKVTNLMTFGLYCDEEYLEKTRETIMSFEGVELAKIDASKGLIIVTGAVDQKRLHLYLEENLRRNVLVVPFWENDITSDGNKVLTNICGVHYGQVKGDIDVVQWLQKLKDDSSRYGGDGYRYRGADEANIMVKEVAAFGNVNGAWRKDKLGDAYTDVNSLYQQNYRVDSQSRWMSPHDRYVSPFSDEDTQSCSIM